MLSAGPEFLGPAVEALRPGGLLVVNLFNSRCAIAEFAHAGRCGGSLLQYLHLAIE